jgi:hypothetical protein
MGAGGGLFVRKLSAGPLGVAGREAGNLPGLLKQAGITAAIPDRGTRPASPPRHRRS